MEFAPTVPDRGPQRAPVLRGFTGRQRVHTSTLVDAGGKLPLVLTFVDTDEHVQRVLPTLRHMAAHRLIVRENVHIEQGLD